MTQETLDALLARFNGKPGFPGTPGCTKGLSHEETISMLQALIDNKQIYNDPDLCAWAEAFAEFGELTGYDASLNCTK